MRKLLFLLLPVFLLGGCDKDEGTSLGYLQQGRKADPVPLKGEWRRYGQMPDFDMLVNVDSISRNDRTTEDKYVYVWMLQRFRQMQIDGVSKGKYIKKYSRHAIECKSGRMASTVAVMTDENDAEMARYEVPGYQWDFSSPPENTYGADFMRQVCKLNAEKEAAKKAKN